MSRRQVKPFFPLQHLQATSPNHAKLPISGDGGSAPNPTGVDTILDFRNARRGRKSRARSVDENNLYDHIRQFLESKKLILHNSHPKTYIEAITSLAQPADCSQVQSYLNRSINWPGEAQMSWEHPMQSPWNQQAISMLVLEFMQNVHHCMYPKLEKLPPVASADWLQGVIENRLTRTRSTLRKLLRPINPQETSEERSRRLQNEYDASTIHGRRNQRKRLRFARRKSTIRTNMERDLTGLWANISNVFQYFVEDDMSSDETEVEDSFQTHKRVRRIRKAWVDESISRLWFYVDSQYPDVKPNGRRKQGAKITLRDWASTSQDHDEKPAPFLPINFYDKRIQGMELASLSPRPPVTIPNVLPPPQDAITETG